MTGKDGADRVRYETREGVATLTVVNPPVNALVQPVRAALSKAIARANDDPAIGAILLRAEGKTFPAGADVKDFTSETAHPTLSELCNEIEASPKPVVAAIHGTALGGGLELALACHYRIADQGARFGFPEVTLGMLPAAGGTQRLPRLVGAGAALELLITGRPIDANRAAAIGLIDKAVQKNLDTAGFGTSRNMASARTRTRPSRSARRGLSDPALFLESVASRRRAMGGRIRPAVRWAIDLVEGALLLPFDSGLDMEHVAYQELVASDTARSLRHAFFAERRAARAPELGKIKGREIRSIGIIGAGPLARDIAQAALATGVPVSVALEDDPAIERARPRIEAALARAVESGRITGRDRDDRLVRLKTAPDFMALADCDIIIEALPEDPVRKAAALGQIGDLVKLDAVIASSTSACDIEALAMSTSRPMDFAAMHFVAPADRNRLVEVAPSAEAQPLVTATCLALARAMGKTPVLMAPRHRLVHDRLIKAYYTAAALTVEAGATIDEVDRAMREFGFPEGPFLAQDRAGIDEVWGRDSDDSASELPMLMLEHAWFGRRTGLGFYRHDDGRAPRVAPEVADMIEGLRLQKRIQPRSFTQVEIQDRCVLAMANEGARLVEAGAVHRVSDVDAVALLGFGFPRDRGGPMLAADLDGALAVRRYLTDLQRENVFWSPTEWWSELVKNGRPVVETD